MQYISYLFKSVVLFLSFFVSFSQANSSTYDSKPIIVLFHGLANHAASFNTLKKGLEQAFPTASVVALTSVEGSRSINLSIQEQVEASFKELANKVDHLGDRSILLIGHSQGGLRAYAFLKQYEHLLRVKGLVTLAAPWEGAPGARVDSKMLAQHLTDPVLNDLCRLSRSLGYPADTLTTQLMLQVQQNQNICCFPGGQDLMEGSAFLCQVKAWLYGEKVAILAIGGGQGDFRALLPKKDKYSFKTLNSMYTFLVVGQTSLTTTHDMWIPLYSQHALNILPKGKKNFKRVLIKDAFHSTHVWAIPIPPSKAILTHPRVLNVIVKFAKKVL